MGAPQASERNWLFSGLASVLKQSVHAKSRGVVRGTEARMEKAEEIKGAACPPGDVAMQLAALQKMTMTELKEKFRELYGQPPRSHNKPYLQKRLAFRVQELAEGGLSETALAKIAELGAKLPERWKRRHSPTPSTSEPERDSRLPAAGSVLTRIYQGRKHRVAVRDDCFIYGGKEFKSLSAIAKRVTGTAWNGFLFFGIQARSGAKK